MDEEYSSPRFLSLMLSPPARGRRSSMKVAAEIARSGLEIPEEAGQLSGRPLPPSARPEVDFCGEAVRAFRRGMSITEGY